MSALPCILSVFPNDFNKFNNTGARMLICIYHMTLNSHFISDVFHLNAAILPLENVTFYGC